MTTWRCVWRDDRRQWVPAVLFGANNLCFVTPTVYQTNPFVMSAGGYRFADFVRGGLPLALIMLTLYGLLLPWSFAF
jgi:di/tricarboxylate transporter